MLQKKQRLERGLCKKTFLKPVRYRKERKRVEMLTKAREMLDDGKWVGVSDALLFDAENWGFDNMESIGL